MVTTLNRIPLMGRADDDQLMRIGIFYPNTPALHVTSPQVRAENPDAMDFRAHAEVARACEEIGLDFIFMPDRWSPYGPACTAAGFQDPIIHAPLLAASMAAVTREIGIVTTMHTTYHHPVHVARIGANLDALTKGRWGLNIVTGFTSNEGDLFGLDEIPHDERYAMADEFLDAVRALWRGGPVDFRGKWFSFHGRLSGPGPLQENPLIVNAGSSPAGRAFAARHADWIFMVGRNEAEVQEKMADAHARTAASGRAAGSVRLMLDLNVILADTDEQAAEEAARVRASVDVDAAREYMVGLLGGMEAYRNIFRDSDELATLTHLGSGAAAVRGHGSAETIAAQIVHLHRDYGCKGLALSFNHWRPEDIRAFGGSVLPLLEDAGVWQSPFKRQRTW